MTNENSEMYGDKRSIKIKMKREKTEKSQISSFLIDTLINNLSL